MKTKMKITIEWQSDPISFPNQFEEGLKTACKEKLIPEKPGIYIFARKYDKAVEPLYIGQAENLCSRIKSHQNNHRLIVGMENAQRGKRILKLGIIKPRRGQQLKKILKIAESAYIEAAILKGYNILNKSGINIKTHEIISMGSAKPFPRKMKVKAEN